MFNFGMLTCIEISSSWHFRYYWVMYIHLWSLKYVDVELTATSTVGPSSSSPVLYVRSIVCMAYIYILNTTVVTADTTCTSSQYLLETKYLPFLTYVQCVCCMFSIHTVIHVRTSIYSTVFDHIKYIDTNRFIAL